MPNVYVRKRVERAAVAARAAGQGDPLVKTEQRHPGRRLLLDQDRDVGHRRPKLWRERGDRLLGPGLELGVVNPLLHARTVATRPTPVTISPCRSTSSPSWIPANV